MLDHIVDGCGFEIITLDALRTSHSRGQAKHKSELCSLFIRENLDKFKVQRVDCPDELKREDLRLTVDNPEDLIVCKAVYKEFIKDAPQIPINKIIKFLDMNHSLKELIFPFTEKGYESMYVWSDNE
jgi:spore coat polysaccharide biosynthesis protein SpsF